MKKFGFLLVALLAGVVSASTANAGFVIDDFSIDSPPFEVVASPNNVPRKITVINKATAKVDGGQYESNAADNANLTNIRSRLQYTFGPAFNALLAPFTGVETFVKLGTLTNTGVTDVVVTGIKNNNPQNPGRFATTTVVAGFSKAIVLKFTDTASGWATLQLNFQAAQGFGHTFELSGPVVLSAVPEPGSMALLGFVAAGGGFARWRKRSRNVGAVNA